MKSGTQKCIPGPPPSPSAKGHFWFEKERDITGPAARSSNQASNLREKSKYLTAPSEQPMARYSLIVSIVLMEQSTNRITCAGRDGGREGEV
jgi:hypothetical protein